ncbi:MAG: energy transducer TonB [Gammaproteobacteria bacterium]|jgi:protein TonB|nr:energy transducer TonB [Gammaproteobacteria bacterium]MBT5216112.1 energy transducer TonB [Gammaproteobacteria bacterium]MBT5542728.1 energy transducer TonB [Gammaproteobacteria bacterium]MBT6073649.1 energy transducer TonB [Gammaproteobacteria bacterium]MBT7753671.1 energy transducer TonB [Gammaproteobacteria bacterium]
MNFAILTFKPEMRYLSAMILGVIVSLFLFFLMQALIDSGDQNYKTSADSQILEFIRIKDDESLSFKDRVKPKKPTPPKEPPPPPKLVVQKQAKPTVNKIKIEIPNIDLPTIAGGGPFLGNWEGNPLAEGDVLPIVRIDPQWPREALIEGIEGYVIVEVTIASDGSVRGASIIESIPKRMFDRSVIRAVLKWKFKPRIINGVAVERKAIQRLDFKLDG